MHRLLLLAFVFIVPTSTAFAEEEGGEPPFVGVEDDANASEASAAPGPTLRYAAVTEIELGGVDINGALRSPSGSQVLARRGAAFDPLVAPREDFIPEMVASVSHIR